jgi:hypothetical protein
MCELTLLVYVRPTVYITHYGGYFFANASSIVGAGEAPFSRLIVEIFAAHRGKGRGYVTSLPGDP